MFGPMMTSSQKFQFFGKFLGFHRVYIFTKISPKFSNSGKNSQVNLMLNLNHNCV